MKPIIKLVRVTAIFILTTLFFYHSYSQYSTQGPLNGSTFSDDNSVGNFPFSIPANAVVSDNNRSSANALLILLNGNTHYLKVTGFGFSIPSIAFITGIRVDIEKSAWDISILATVKDNDIKLVKGGVTVGNNKADGSSWTDTDTYDSYGDTTDTWGTTLTPAEVNSSDFGIAFSAKINGLISLIPTARVDHIRITVFYIIPLPIHFIDFKVESNKGNGVTIKWTTADNDERANFTIQRSINSSDWTDIFSIPGEISWSQKKYEYIDHPSVTGQRFFYRVKMTLISGAVLYTKIGYAAIDDTQGFNLFPNPSRSYVYVSSAANENISLFTINGKRIKLISERVSASIAKINTAFLKPGLYFIKVGEKQKQLLVQ